MSHIWNRIKERLKDEMEKQSFLTWIENTYVAIDNFERHTVNLAKSLYMFTNL